MCFIVFFFFNDPATPEISTLPLPDALPIPRGIGLGYYHACHILENKKVRCFGTADPRNSPPADVRAAEVDQINRSEEHTSELQSRQYLVCRLLLEKKKNKKIVYVPQCYLLK